MSKKDTAIKELMAQVEALKQGLDAKTLLLDELRAAFAPVMMCERVYINGEHTFKPSDAVKAVRKVQERLAARNLDATPLLGEAEKALREVQDFATKNLDFGAAVAVGVIISNYEAKRGAKL